MGRRPARQNEVLGLLAHHGVMNSYTLSQLIKPALSTSRLRNVLATLKKNKLIVSGTLKIDGSPANYWMLASGDKVAERVMDITGLAASDLRLKSSHWSQYPHENLCTLFQAAVERQMPSVKVLRESANSFSELPDHLIVDQIRDNGYLPDICLGVPTSEPSDTNTEATYKWVAVEIDRTNRSKKRIAARTNIYSRHTSFDGLLYLMPDERAVRVLGEIYNTEGASESLRISGSKTSFLATGKAPRHLFSVNDLRLLCGEQEVLFTDWLSMIALSNTKGRDELLLRFPDTGASKNET